MTTKTLDLRVTSIQANERIHLTFGGEEIRPAFGMNVTVTAEGERDTSLTFQHYIEDRAQAIQVGDRLSVTVEHAREAE